MLNATSTAVPAANDGLHVPAELDASLRMRQACISPKFLYDPLGSKLFEAICELPEYYPTRTEAGIFDLHGAEIARTVGAGSTLIDLGAGNCAKAANLFPLLVLGGLVTIVPMIVLFTVLQRYWRGGLLLGSVAN